MSCRLAAARRQQRHGGACKVAPVGPCPPAGPQDGNLLPRRRHCRLAQPGAHLWMGGQGRRGWGRQGCVSLLAIPSSQQPSLAALTTVARTGMIFTATG